MHCLFILQGKDAHDMVASNQVTIVHCFWLTYIEALFRGVVSFDLLHVILLLF